MARTKEQLIEIIVDNKELDLIQAVTWSTLVDAVSNMTADQKTTLINMIVLRDDAGIGLTLYNAVKEQVRADATVGVTTLLNDDNLSLTELDLIL